MIFSNRSDNFLLKLLLLILIENFQLISAEYFSSVHEMSSLVELEGKLLGVMEKFVQRNEDKLDYLKARLAEFERERDEAVISGPAYFDSPINQYLMTKRLSLDWERIANFMEYETGQKFLKRLDKLLYGKNNLTSYREELNGAIAGILNMQETYRIPTKDIAAGILQGVHYNTTIDSHLCFNIGMHAMELKKFRQSYFWLMEAKSRFNDSTEASEEQIEKLDKTDIIFAIANAQTELNDIRGANSTYAQLLELKPDSEVLARAYMIFTLENGIEKHKDFDYSHEFKPIPADLSELTDHERWMLTCAGQLKKTPSEERELRCGYLTETHPFLWLAPIKVEELNHNPLLVQYYDVLYDSEIEEMKRIFNHRVTRATVVGKEGGVVSPVRTSQFLFVKRQKHKVLEKIDQRVEDMTMMDMNNAEDHQFQNYGIGGAYMEHVDYFGPERLERPYFKRAGNRIATMLFYLTDVEQGGGTAYPFLKQVLLPKKGSAAFWFNLHASLEGDRRTQHGGCPIIVGSKWVLNRWIHANGQDKTRPCELFNDVVLEQRDKSKKAKAK